MFKKRILQHYNQKVHFCLQYFPLFLVYQVEKNKKFMVISSLASMLQKPTTKQGVQKEM